MNLINEGETLFLKSFKAIDETA